MASRFPDPIQTKFYLREGFFYLPCEANFFFHIGLLDALECTSMVYYVKDAQQRSLTRDDTEKIIVHLWRQRYVRLHVSLPTYLYLLFNHLYDYLL